MADWFNTSTNPGKNPALFLGVMLLFSLGTLLAPSLWSLPVAILLWLIFLAAFRPGWIRAGLALGLIIFVILESAIFLFMILDGHGEKAVTGQETLIVPGGGVVGREPSYYVKRRLDEAARILKEHPGMPVIVTGYQPGWARISEARAMKEYLLDLGIREERIIEEDRAHDTIRNFEYSAAIIAERGLPREVIIVTNEFHSFRCSYLARRNGLNPLSVPVLSARSDLPWLLLREAGSWLKVQFHFGLAGS